MAVFSAIATAVGSIASSIGSALGSFGGVLGGLSAAAGVAGTIMNFAGQRKAARGAERAEALRMRQMNLEAARERRSTVRQSVIARAQALNQGAAQGATGSSGLQGGVQNVTSQAGTNFQSIGMNQSIGQGMFEANRMISSGQTLSSIGQTVQGFGSMLTQNREAWSRQPGFRSTVGGTG